MDKEQKKAGICLSDDVISFFEIHNSRFILELKANFKSNEELSDISNNTRFVVLLNCTTSEMFTMGMENMYKLQMIYNL